MTKTGYQEVETMLLTNMREKMDTSEAAKDERHMARKLAEHRGLSPDFADDLAGIFNNIDNYESPEKAMAELDWEDY